MTSIWFLLALLLSAPAPQDDARPIFDGETLAGWEGDPRFWSVEDGAIVGRSTAETPCDATTYLVWRGGAPADFELSLSFKIEGGNSGVQVRSREVGRWKVAGYQADIEDGTSWTGCLYEQDGRGVVARRGERVSYDADGARSVERFGEDAAILASFRRGEWNDYRIVARGARLTFELNGVTTCELIDRDAERRSGEGLIALQLHAGPPMTVRFKDLRLTELEPASEEVPAAAAPSRQRWIWLPGEPGDGQVVCFQRAFEVTGDVAAASLTGSCDNVMDVFLNGELVASSTDWARPLRADVEDVLVAGANLLAVLARNEGGPAGLQLELGIEQADGSEERIVTDADWRVAPGEPAGWKTARGTGDEWVAPELLGPLGVAPWGALQEPSRAAVASVLPADEIELPPGFRAELVYTVPRALEGSWVALTDAPGGVLYASAQSGGLYRVVPPPLDGAGAPCEVERVDVDLGDAQGLLWAFDALYVVVNSGRHQSGLYRLTDADGDGRLDAVEQLKALDGAGEHGPHAVLLGPEGDRLYVLAGNHTKLPEGVPARSWGEDHLLPQRPDPRGHAVGIRAPGGWLCRTDPDGEAWELVSWGMRNAYDIAFDPEGECFTFDSDMEWDVGLPWYRPTRVLHLVPHADFGWRTGSGKWPASYPDSLPGVVDIGLSSPTGVLHSRGLSFPPPYDRALFIADWAYGRIHAVHLEPHGASFTGKAERFAAGRPLPVTDLAAGADGALYFAIGGRGMQSALYRVRYEHGLGSPIFPYGDEAAHAAREARAKRRALEWHVDGAGRPRAGTCPPSDALWETLDDADRFLRYAARVAIESCDPSEWRARALAEAGPRAMVEALVALARRGQASDLAPIVERLGAVDFAQPDAQTAIGALRGLQLAFVRLGQGEPALRRRLAEQLLAAFPDGRRDVDRELLRLLAYLDEPRALPGALALLEDAPDQKEAVQIAFALRNLETGWSPDQRRALFAALDRLEAGAHGGASFQQYVRGIRDEIREQLPEGLAAELQRREGSADAPEPPALDLAGRPTHRWTLAELDDALARVKRGRDYETGAMAYRAATCHTCHRMAGAGGSTGPDLTGAGGRFQPRDLLEAILDPSAVVSDQYRDLELLTVEGELLVGRIEMELDGMVVVRTLPPEEDTVELFAEDVASRRPHPLSRMPEGLVDQLTEEELLDLMAYVLAGGDREDAAFEDR